MKLTRSQVYILILAILALVIAVLTNIATNQIPERLKPYLWYSWPVLLLLVIVFIVLTLMSHRAEEQPAIPSTQFDLKRYCDALTKRYRTLDLDALTPPQKEEYLQLQLQAVFVEQSVRENPPPIELPKEILEKLQQEGQLKIDDLPEGITIEEIRASGDSYYKNPPIPVIDVITNPEKRHTVVLGDPGSGKSTLARYLMLSLVDTYDPRLRRAFPNFMPVLVELRTFNALREERKCDTFLEFLEFLGKTEGWNLTQASLHEILNIKGAFIIFDGLDEVFDAGDRERISHAIVGFAQTYPKAGILVTSRIVGYHRKALTDAGFAHYTLQDLNREQVESFISRWYDLALADRPDDANKRKQRILESFGQSASVRQLAGNPMLLTIMAIIGKHQELPRERWKLYDHAASVLIEHWDVKRHLESLNVDAPFIGEDDKKELLRRLAYRMQEGDAGLKGNYIHRDQLQQEFQSYLIERFTLPADRATTISRLMIEQFRQRNFILSLYGATVYGFVHRAFLEYFCATAFTYKFEKAHELTIDQLAEQVFGAHWSDESWHEVLRLICGILDERFAGKLINYLLKVRRTSEKESDSPPENVELAVRCIGEVRNINSVVEATDLALEVIFEAFEKAMADAHNENFEFILRSTSAISQIGIKWPNRARIAGLLNSFKSGDWALLHEVEFAKFVVSIGAGLKEVRDALMDYASREDPNLRLLWPAALAAGWKDDPRTVTMLKAQISNDAVGICRRAATRPYIGRYGLTPESISLMSEILQHDPDDQMRHLAMRHLVQANDPSLFSLLKAGLSDRYGPVRAVALRGLLTNVNDEGTFSLLLDRALKEPYDFLRKHIYTELNLRRPNDPRLRGLLYNQARIEESPEGRQHLLRMLVTSYSEDPKTTDLLKYSSTTDSEPAVRALAKELLESIEVS